VDLVVEHFRYAKQRVGRRHHARRRRERQDLQGRDAGGVLDHVPVVRQEQDRRVAGPAQPEEGREVPQTVLEVHEEARGREARAPRVQVDALVVA